MLSAQADLVHILRGIVRAPDRWCGVIAGDTEIAFAEKDQFRARNGIFLDGSGDDPLGVTIGIDVGGLWHNNQYRPFGL